MINRTSWCHFEDSMYIFYTSSILKNTFLFTETNIFVVHKFQRYYELQYLFIGALYYQFKCKNVLFQPLTFMPHQAHIFLCHVWELLKWFVWCSLSRWILRKYFWAENILSFNYFLPNFIMTLLLSKNTIFFVEED